MTYPSHFAFTAQRGSAFQVADGTGAAVALELGSVSPPAGDPAAEGPAAFSLIFLGDDMLRLSQGIHLFSHPQLGEFDLFIVPLGPTRTDARMQYEAVFN